MRERRGPGARAAVRLHPRLCRGHRRRLRLVHAARRGPAPGRGHEPPHQTTEGGHRQAHARAHRCRRRRRLDPRLRHEDDGVRARRRAQLDGALVSRRRHAQARTRLPIVSSTCSTAASAAAIDERGIHHGQQTRQSSPPPRARPSAHSRACSRRLTAPQLGAAAIRGALAAAGIAGSGRPGSHHGLRVARGPGPGPRAPGCARRRRAQGRAHHHHQQDVRLGHEGHHDGRRPDSRRRRVHRGGRRPRVHDQRALSTAEGARRHAHGARRSARSHVLRRPAEPVRRPAHGRVRGEHGAEVFVLARRSGRVRHRIDAARA